MSLPPLNAGDFPAFFKALWGYDPFPWQARLAQEVAVRGRWPDLLDLPTGSGKTAAIDVAVFHLAMEADKGGARKAAMRIAFVVDRRLIVDEAHARAMQVAKELKDAADRDNASEVVRAVALRLRSLAGQDQPPLIAQSLRGGAPREDDWARTPCQPTVLCSTVDQVGSRLMFRGYGVSDRMRPVQAGLVGSDALILLDEAHLSEPFRQTAEAIAHVRAIRGEDAAPFQTALLTATPGEKEGEGEWRFRLGPEDRRQEVLARRLAAAKPATVVAVAGDEEARAAELAAQALDLVEVLRGADVVAPVVGVVANRVARARKVFDLLRAGCSETFDCELVIGRARSAERQDIAAELLPIKTGASPRPARPFILVATQTIEAGVDIDLDALVTDAASLDALRQRFGRVNRDGRWIPARGIIVADKADRKPKQGGDPIYGEAIARTLDALFPEGGGAVDFGISALDAVLARLGLNGPAIGSLLSEKPDAPVLMPAYVDLWTHTSPRPSADPEPSLFLHGPKREPASVQLVWRADLDGRLDPRDPEQSERMRFLLSLAPPLAAEAIELPVWAVQRWLRGETHFELGDVDQAEVAATEPVSPKGPVFRWRGVDDDGSRIIDPRGVRAGDVIVVPSRYGGCDRYGWKPDGDAPVTDIYERAGQPHDGRRYVVRIAPGLIGQAILAEPGDEDEAVTEDVGRQRREARTARIAAAVRATLTDPSASARQIGEALLGLDLPQPLEVRLTTLLERARRRGRGGKAHLDPPAYPYGGEEGDRTGVVLVAPFGVEDAPEADRSDVAGTEDDEAGSFTGAAQALAEHSQEVSAMARDFAERAGLAENLAADLSLAAWLHDAGKADLRFQRLLYGGDLLAIETGGVLAKSAQGRSPPGAAQRAGLPPHWRHEALSVRLALDNLRLQEAHDRGLVLWLVGTHHGHGRPFFPHHDQLDETQHGLAAVEGLCSSSIGAGAGPQSLAFAIESETCGPSVRDPRDLRGLDWFTLFRDLKRRYGPWGLARLEAVLRLADHRASEAARERSSEVEKPA